MKDKKVLLVIIPDILSDLIKKGELTERYYNPGNLFDEVHILLTNNDQPDLSKIQKMVGTAKLFIHNHPFEKSLFITSLGYNPYFLNSWAKPVMKLATEIKPNLIRCHGNHLNTYLGAKVKQKLKIPLVVSLHTDYYLRVSTTVLAHIRDILMEHQLESYSLRYADKVLPVYSPIVPYILRMGVKKEKIEIAYNVLNPGNLRKKTSFILHKPIKLISVGRHYDLKNPENIIKAVASLPNVSLTLVGNGSHQQYLEDLVVKLAIENRVKFMPAVNNDDLCKMLPEFDIFVVHTDQFEISKAVLEALLTGLPVVINKRPQGLHVFELEQDFITTPENSIEGYLNAIKNLLENDKLRKELGEKGYKYAQEHWSPKKTEQKYVQIYKDLLLSSKRLAILYFPVFGSGLIEKVIRLHRNPRDEEYMTSLVYETFGKDVELLSFPSENVKAKVHAADEIVLLWPDAIGCGWFVLENKIFKNKNSNAVVSFLNGRRRFRNLGNNMFSVEYLKILLLRFLETSRLGELIFLLVFALLSPIFVIYDLMRGKL